MYAVEFETTITNGVIEVPASYRDQVSGSVRVIILADASSTALTATAELPYTNMILHLLTHPRAITTFTPLKRDAIYERA